MMVSSSGSGTITVVRGESVIVPAIRALANEPLPKRKKNVIRLLDKAILLGELLADEVELRS